MSLREATTDLHHAAERHPWGARMARGEISPQEWADWIGALRVIHEVLDPQMTPAMHRGGALLLDQVVLLPIAARPVEAALRYARQLSGPVAVAGAAYVFGGAHLRGGAVIRKRLEPLGLPCAHLRFHDARGAHDWLTALREAPGVEAGARDAFAAIIRVMDELEPRQP